MKKIFISTLGALMVLCAYPQTVRIWTENFDGNNITFTASPATAWKKDTNYYLSPSNSMQGIIPNKTGDEIELVSPVYDFRKFTNVLLRFSHICKVSPRDIVHVEYRRNMGGGMGAWEKLSHETYLGKANVNHYRRNGFNADSYSEWKGNDSLAFPHSDWWKEEIFDLWYEVGGAEAQFRFLLKRGSTLTTQISYGWLIDNIEIIAANHQLIPPKVEWMGIYPRNTVYNVGPFTINAKVKTGTTSGICIPYLVHTSTFNGVSVTDSIRMHHVQGDSLWSVVLPPFEAGTSVVYSITGKDSLGNYTTVMSKYTVEKPSKREISGEVIVGTGTNQSNFNPFGIYWRNSWNQQLYLASELDPNSTGGFITKLSWDYSSTAMIRNHQTCYLQAVDEVNISSNMYINPVAAGATQVWTGTIHLSQGWSEITLEQPFYLPPGKNLLVYWEHRHGSFSSSYFNTHSTGSRKMTVYCVNDPSFPSDVPGTFTENRPNIKLFMPAFNFSDNSIALLSINSPIQGQTTGNSSTPIMITIQNKGDSILQNATVHWTVNGGQVNTYSWTGNLSWDFQDTVTIGNIVPSLEKYDTVLVWVSLPNGQSDTARYDDTLSVIIYGCTPNMSGTYRIGATGIFKNIQDAINVLNLCTPLGGDITFELETGTYTENINLQGLSKILGENSLTITSVTSNPNDVIIKPVSGTGITLSQSNNIIIKNITVDITTKASYGIQFTGACRNILIRDCNLLADTTTTITEDDNLIYAENIDNLDSIFIIRNFISGGKSGIYITGSSSNRTNKNIVIDSNIIQNIYSNTIVLNYEQCISVSYNTILSRSSNVSSEWHAIEIFSTHIDNIIGNRIIQRSNLIKSPIGITCRSQLSASFMDTVLIANNEMILDMSNYGVGINAEEGRVKIINNSIYVKGSEDGKGISIDNYSMSSHFIVKNNNIVMEASNAYPVHFPSTTYLQCYDFDYNNMYAPKYVGYAGSAKTTLDDWKQTVSTDLHSVSIRPDFIDSASHLKLSDYTGLKCLKNPSVTLDIDNRIRTGEITSMGTYHGITPDSINALLTNISGNRNGAALLGDADSISVTLINTGTTTLTKATVKWEWNGLPQQDVIWTGTLTAESKTNIPLGEIIHSSAGYYTIKAWIDNLDMLIDEYPVDDTTNATAYICITPFKGIYQMGMNNADFTSIRDFMNKLALCGAGGDITLAIQPGIYTEIINLSNLSQLLGGNRLIITSTTGIATDVTIKTIGTGITLSQSNNIVIKAITVDATKGIDAIRFTGACTNVVIRDCRLLTDTITTGGTSPFYISRVNGLDSIFIINNFIDGGVSGITIKGNYGTVANTNLVIDSNTIQNNSSYGISTENNNYLSISHNRILSRSSNINNSWSGIDMYNTHVKNMIGNRIIQRNKGIKNPLGVYAYGQANVSLRDTILFANNEIILYVTNSSFYGINFAACRAKILHNSIYIGGSSGYAKGIMIESTSNAHLTIKNNNIVMESPVAYPIWLPNFNSSEQDIDNNNIYASAYVGYAGANKLTISDWQQTVTTDHHSVSVNPSFRDKNTSLELVSPYGIICPALSTVIDDIELTPRTGAITTLGCYHGFSVTDTVNGMLASLFGWGEGHLLGKQHTIKVVLMNMASTSLTSATIGWSYNGNQKQFSWSGNLGLSKSDTITLGSIDYLSAGEYTLAAWIADLGGLTDKNPQDDTIRISGYICPSSVAGGVYSVGATGVYPSFQDALKRFALCGVSGDITLALETGTYTCSGVGIDLSNISNIFGNHSLTITSVTGDANDVIIQTDATGIRLSNSNNIFIKAITVDATKGSNAIQFEDACTNIVIRDCKLLADPIAVSGVPVYSNMGGLDTVFIINNLIDGGEFGINFLNYSGRAKNRNILIDSNIIQNNYLNGISMNNIRCLSISHNTIASRISNVNNYNWYGINVHDFHADNIVGNRIIQRSNNIQYPRGMIFDNQQNIAVGETMLISNNEVILNINVSDPGISIGTNCRVKIIHNSIYIKGTDKAKGIEIAESSATVKNNNIVMESSDAFPLYLNAFDANNDDIDYNNMYAPVYVGYAGGNMTTIKEWQEVVTTDRHSVSICPDFIDSTVNLKLENYTGFKCIPLPEVVQDIEGIYRTGDTANMGAYHGTLPFNENGTLIIPMSFSLRQGTVLGLSDSLKVALINTGATLLTEATIAWKWNNVSQPNVVWTGALASNEKIIITLGEIVYQEKTNTATAWIDALGVLTDQYAKDDTVNLSGYVCNAPYNGSYLIGATGIFTSPVEFISLLSICGANGDITLNIQPGNYQGSIDLSKIASEMGNYSLTITSTTNKAEDVVIRTTHRGIVLGNNNNMTLKNLTVDATAGTIAVLFASACSNIVIRDCRLLSNPKAKDGYPIYADNVGDLNSIFILHNHIDGGAYGIFLSNYNGGGMNTNLVIDSNSVQNNSFCGIIMDANSLCTSISYNTISSRSANANPHNWTGLVLVSSHADNVVGNRIIQRNSEIKDVGGIQLNDQQAVSSDTVLIANNEIILNTTQSSFPGISAASCCVRIIHNSIYNRGIETAEGIAIQNNSNSAYFMIKNNNIVMENPAAVPLYLDGYNTQQFDIDYNNMCAPLYIGYAGINFATLAAWKQTVITDIHSVRVQPNFFNKDIGLDLLDSTGLGCALLPEVSNDILGLPRSQKTTIGAYHYFNRPTDVYPYSFVGISDIYPSMSKVPLAIRIKNDGLDTLKSATVHWIYNGTYHAYLWTGVVPPYSLSNTLSIDTLTIVENYNDLVLYTTLPNGMSDTRIINDTIRKAILSCDSLMHGVYTVGITGDFANIKEAIQLLKTCGVNGDITLALLPGIYQEEINLNNIALGYNLTITSTTDNADDVLIKTTGMGITLRQSNNITIKAITVDVVQGDHAIQFTGACQNIIIRDCKLLANTAIRTDGNNLVYARTGGLDNISIINNLLDGGYYGIYFYGDYAMINTNIIIDSNTVQNNYYCGLYMENYNKCISISCNSILSRTVITNTMWYGMRLYYTHADHIINNRIIQRSNEIVHPYGLYFYSQQYLTPSDTALIINNEIILNMASNSPGISIGNSCVKIINNSIYVDGSGEARGIVINNTNSLTVRNNNIVMKSPDAYPVYLSGTSALQYYDFDYNNMYAPKYVGYADDDKTTIAEWQQIVTMDTHSVSILPAFIDRKTSLAMTDSVALLCPRNNLAMKDIRGYARLDTTDIGAYYTPKLLDATAVDIMFSSLHTTGVASTPTFIIQNTGRNPITSLTVVSSNNGVLEMPVVINGINVLSLDTIKIPLNTVVPLSGNNTVSAWITEVNGGLDQVQVNDTVHLNIYGCTAPMKGVYSIGTGGDFTSIEEAVLLMKNCGANDSVTLYIKDGVYNGHLDLASVATAIGGYPLTITSENGDTALACIQSLPNMPAVTLGKNANVSIRNLSIRATKQATNTVGGTHAILFTEGCDNIVIDGCALYADQSATSINQCAILKKDNTGQISNIRITNNYIDGGYAGIWFHGGKSGSYGTDIVIDSNIVQNHYYSGIYLRYNNKLSLSHNTVLSKGSASHTLWYAIALFNSNGSVTANRIRQRGTGITLSYGIYASYYNQHLTQDTGLIANNEIMVGTSSSSYSIYVANSRANILHNSIRVKGSGQLRGVHIEHASNNIIALKNNNIVMESTTAYPVYLSSVADMSRYDIDYNNIYAPVYAGYAGENIFSLAAWKQAVPTDKHSVKVLPNYADIATDLKLLDNAYVVCPLSSKVPLTIDGQNRQSITSMGAYTHVDAGFDFMLQDITHFPAEVVKGQRVPVSVKVVNMGDTVINSAVLGWSVNGIVQPSVSWTTSSLAMYSDAEISVGTAIVPDAETMNVKIWIENLNNTGSPDMIRWNDTVNRTSTLIPLAWYTEPFLKDTVNTLSFPVYAVIKEETGALTAAPPTLHVTTIAADKTLSNTFPMTYENGQWIGRITNQYYGSKVIYTLTVSDTVGNTVVLQDSVVVKYIHGSEVYSDYNLSVIGLYNGLKIEELCSPDYSTVSVSIANTGKHDYDFSNSNMNISLRLTTPIVFNKDTLITTGTLLSGEIMKIDLTQLFPVMIAGEYNVKVWTANSSDAIPYDDTLVYNFVSGRFGLIIDKDFSNGMPMIFENIQGNTSATWQAVSQGTGADTAVKPVYGSQMLSFHGSRGAMVQMKTKRLDLSSTLSPALDLWYFHDTVPAEDDYTEVRVTIDGGRTYTTILSLTKYNTTYGWKRYTVDLPLFAINQCVIILFEAMEKDINSNVTQYIDRIRITAKQDIAISKIFTTDYSVCDMKNKEWKVVVSNLTDPVLDFTLAPATITLEISGTDNKVFTQRVQTGSISGFSADTFTLASNFDLDKDTYIAKAYIDANTEDNNPVNDTLVFTLTVNPKMSVQLTPASGVNACLSGEMEVWQRIILTNTGNMDLFNIDLTLQIDTGDINLSPYITIGETCTDTVHIGESVTYTFKKPYAAPWYATYYAGVTAYTSCDVSLANAKHEIVECVNTRDLYLVSIDNPSTDKDKVGDVIQVMTTLYNRSDHVTFVGMNITVLVENSQGIQTAKFTEKIEIIGTLATINHNFTKTYTVPNDTVYYLTVYIDHYDDYPYNDTITLTRYTDAVGIASTVSTDVFTLGQNVPNPAIHSTRIDYSVPEAGKVIFHVYSISGQLLYSKTIDTKHGTNSIELNTNTFAAGVYFYSMEYKGQRLMKQLIIKD
jgi:hypothetical protein